MQRELVLNKNSKMIKFKYLVILFVVVLINLNCLKDEEHKENETEIPLKVSNIEAWKGIGAVRFKKELLIGTDDFDNEEYFFSLINDIGIDKDGYIYVLDNKNFRVQIYSPEGKFFRTFELKEGQNPGEFKRPVRIAIDNNKNLYVADMYQQGVSIFNSEGQLIKVIKTEFSPADIAVGNKEEMYLTGFFDSGNFRIYKYNIFSGNLESTFCKSRKETKLVAEAGGAGNLYVDNEGYLFFGFFYPYDIRKFSHESKLLNRFARRSKFFLEKLKQDKITGNMQYNFKVTALAGLPDGKIIVAIANRDSEKRNAYFSFDIFDENGQWLLNIPSTELESTWIRILKTDIEGNLYLDYIEPFPHIRKYSMEFITN